MTIDTLIKDLVLRFLCKMDVKAKDRKEVIFGFEVKEKLCTQEARDFMIEYIPSVHLKILKGRLKIMGKRSYPKFVIQIESQIKDRFKDEIIEYLGEGQLEQWKRELIKAA